MRCAAPRRASFSEQERIIRRGVDIVVGTPGAAPSSHLPPPRLAHLFTRPSSEPGSRPDTLSPRMGPSCPFPGRVKDFIERGVLDLSKLAFRVLDEADEMLNMGFVEDVEFILSAGAVLRKEARSRLGGCVRVVLPTDTDAAL